MSYQHTVNNFPIGRKILRHIAVIEAERKNKYLLEQSHGKKGLDQKQYGNIMEAFVYIDRNLAGFANGYAEGKLREAMITADFTNALMSFVQHQLIPGYQTRNFNYELFVPETEVPNYQITTIQQGRSSLPDLTFRGSQTNPNQGNIPDSTPRPVRVYDWDRDFVLDFHMLVNDYLGYFKDQAADMGRAARRTKEKFVSRLVTNAVSVARLTALGALYFTTGRFNSTRVSTARMAFNQRLDGSGEPIFVPLKYIIFHSGLEDTSRVVLNSELVPETANNARNLENMPSLAYTPIPDPYLAGTSPDLPWYAVTDYRSSGVRPVVLVRLQNRTAPWILRKKSDIESITSVDGVGIDVTAMMGSFATGNINLRVWDVWGTYIDTVTNGNLFDENGVFYSDGTAP